MTPIRHRLVLGVTVFALWVILALPLSLQELVVGVIVTGVIMVIPLPGVSVYGEIRVSLKRSGYAAIFLFVFIRAVVKSNLDVASRVLSPTLPINPGIVRVKTALKSRIGRLLLANSITLTPGTITVAIEGEDIYVHWINTTTDDLEESTRRIVSDFEKYLEVSFG